MIGEFSDQAPESTAIVKKPAKNTVQSSDSALSSRLANTVQNSAGQASREMNVAQLDAGFGLLQPVLSAYPALAKRKGRAGRVRLELGIAPDGRVYRINVVDETPGWGFGPSAESAYRNARFTRPTVGGRPVRVLWRKTVIFRP
jgi:TonB family protein